MYEGQVTAAVERPSAADVDAIGLHMMGGEGTGSAVDATSTVG